MSEYFLYVGSAYPHKNLKRLIEAMKLLNTNSRQKYDLVLVSGRNLFIERLNTSIKRMDAEKFVKLLGFISDARLKVLYKNSIGFVFPSLSEGFGLPGLEAIEAGTLLLSSDIAVFREVYRDYAIYFDPHDTKSIVDVMQKAINMKPEERKKQIAKAQEFAKRYSWAKMARETLAIYEQAGCNSLR